MYIYNLKRQINECFLFANETIWLIDFATGNVLYLGSVVAIYFEVVDFLATLAADVGELLLTLDAEVATACEIGGDARSAATSEWVENPSVLVGRCENDAGEQGERLLRGVLAAGFFPRGDGGQSPHVGHLLVIVQVLHQLVVEMVWTLGAFSCPDDELGRVSKVAAGDVGRGIGFCPCDYVENLKAQFGEAVGYGEDVVIGAGNPDGSVLLQLVAAKAYPSLVEFVDFLGRATSVPFALVDADYFSSLHRYSVVGEEVWRVGKYHVEMEIELREQFKGIAMKEGEVA